MSRLTMSLLSVFLLAASARAAFVKQPYLQNLASSSVVVRFETATPMTGKVQFGLTTSYGAEATDPAPGVDHELTLPSLNADTVYHYRAIAGVDTSPDGKFMSMASVSRPFRFMAYGDNCVDSTAHQSVVDRMLTVNPPAAVAVNVGDQSVDGGSAQYQTFFNVEAGLARRTTLFPVIGNHEQDSMANWYRFFALPGNERWYRFRYGNSSFIGLNVYETYTPGSAQYDSLLSWLLADSADANVWHTFVFFHEPPYTTNTAHEPNLTVRTYLCPLFERFKVAVSFQGHVHAWEHSLVNGVHHIITGGGGAPLYNNWNAPDSWTVYREATYEFTLVDVRGDTISCRGIRPDGTVFDSFQLVPPRHDVGCTRIVAPAGDVDSGQSVTPACSLYNYGNQAESYAVRMKVGGSYDVAATVTSHAPGTRILVSFPSSWTAGARGTYAVTCSTESAGDRIGTNDKQAGSVTVTSGVGGWTAKTPLPAGAKPIKDGGWLAYDAGTARIYATRGQKQPDFFCYNSANDSWKALAPWLTGTEGKLPQKGSAGCADGSGHVYATKGNNTRGFWEHDATGNAWTQKKDVPLGPTNKKVKGGTDIVWAYKDGTGYAYLLKGYKNEFWRYHTEGDSWHQLPSAPVGSNLKYDKGSWLAWDDVNKEIYAFKAKYHEFYRYSPDGDSWSAALAPMPVAGSAGSKKAKDGCCGTYISGSIYALKGGNTREFWEYTIATNTWAEKETIPRSVFKKKVKAGADIVAVGVALYATKGNKTNELWKYLPSDFLLQPEPGREGVMAERSAIGDWRLAISPNPLASDLATVRFSSTSTPVPLSVRIYNATGRLVHSSFGLRTSSFRLDLRSMPAGVYLVKFSSEGFSSSQKLVVQR